MSGDNQNVLEKLSSEYYSFTASEKKLADYAMTNQESTAYLSISELAAACDVAEATVSRFCRRLGYKGYNEFKLAFANVAVRHRGEDNPLSGEISQTDSLRDISRKLLAAETEAMTQTMELLDLDAVAEAADKLEKASHVYCMGQGGSMLLASEAAHLFSTVSSKFTAVSDSHMQAIAATMMNKDDVILFFSYSGSTKAMMQTLALAAESGGKTILVTRFPNSPGAMQADIVLQCGANENPLQSGSVAARIAQMYLLDVLFSEFSRRNLEEAVQNRSRIARALAQKHLQ